MRELLATIALGVAAAGCGGKTGDGAGNDGGNAIEDGAALDAPWRDDRFADPACGEVSVVFAGSALVGAWDFDAGSQTFVPHSTCELPSPTIGTVGNKTLHVPQFFLMALPATNICYSECVKRGACTEPVHDINDPDPRLWSDEGRAGEPVYVDHSQATAFCQWLGGRLPTWAELVRAAQGDGRVPGVAAMTQAAIACAAMPDPASQLCGQIKQMDFFFGPAPRLYDVGQIALDTGPFTQRDLFGSVVEWTSTYFDQSKFCALSDGSADFGTFPEPPIESGPQHVAMGFATQILASIRVPSVGVGAALADDATASYWLGFRCAF